MAIGSSVLYIGTGDFSEAENEFEIAMLSFRGERLGMIRDTVSPKDVTVEHTRRLMDERADRASGDNERRAIRKFFEALDYPEVFPAHGRLLVDPLDNLWVEEYLPLGEHVQTWRVYSPEGVRVGTVETPTGFRVLEAGAEHVVGIRRNELDVLFVEVYSLVKSTTR